MHTRVLTKSKTFGYSSLKGEWDRSVEKILCALRITYINIELSTEIYWELTIKNVRYRRTNTFIDRCDYDMKC
jgi:hypothetical protein